MSAEIIKKYSTGKIKLLIKGITPAMANTLRRCILDQVPTMAIDEVEFIKNSSATYDEMLAHRLGLLVLETDLKSYNIKEECTCEGAGCSKCTLVMTLKVKGPCLVYAENIKSKDPKVIPVHGKTIITKLLKGQELEFQAIAALGLGATHIKHSPGLAWYEYVPTITVNNAHADFDAFKTKYPPQVFKDGKIEKKLIEELDLADACEGINNEIVTITRDPEKIWFYLEPWGQLTHKEILTTALDAFQTILTRYETAIDKAHN
ncbi:MAG: DNA-directed RNA polymerase subunit D [Candidatus Woesearchaeota archaeon]|nr:DNA-directed RNA polymerase subunit D [Candidatus Woesearchaeota archaeon]